MREQPGTALEGMGVLHRHASHAGLPDVGDYGLGGDEVGQLLEICVAVGGGQAADHTGRAALVPAQAPTIGVLAALHAQGVCAVKQLVGDAAGVA